MGRRSTISRNNALDARNYFNNVGLPQNPFHNNQFGGSLSGPIVHDKLFFFADYEGTRESGAQATASCVPTANDILYNAPTPGDLASINPVVANILAQKGWPKPTGTGSCLGNPVDGPAVASGTNTVLSTPFLNDINGGIIKVDYNVNANNSLTGRYYIGDSTQVFPLALVGGGALPGYSTSTPTRVQLISQSFVSVMTPAVVNEARLGWNRFAEGFFPQDGTFDPASIGLNTGGLATTWECRASTSVRSRNWEPVPAIRGTAWIRTGTSSTISRGKKGSTTSSLVTSSDARRYRKILTRISVANCPFRLSAISWMVYPMVAASLPVLLTATRLRILKRLMFRILITFCET